MELLPGFISESDYEAEMTTHLFLDEFGPEHGLVDREGGADVDDPTPPSCCVFRPLSAWGKCPFTSSVTLCALYSPWVVGHIHVLGHHDHLLVYLPVMHAGITIFLSEI